MVCHEIFVQNFLTLDKCWSCRFWGWIQSAWTFDNQFERCQLFSVEMRLLLSSASLELQLLLSSPVWIFLRPLSCTDLVVYVFYLGASSDYEISSVSVCSSIPHPIDLFFLSSTTCLLSASQHHVWVFPLLPERQQKLRTQIVYNGLPKFLGRLLYAYLHPLLGADELSG
jgi:hypothetical protein